ncbi:unnamed protein product, partial [Choristocarpus tenellus]
MDNWRWWLARTKEQGEQSLTRKPANSDKDDGGGSASSTRIKYSANTTIPKHVPLLNSHCDRARSVVCSGSIQDANMLVLPTMGYHRHSREGARKEGQVERPISPYVAAST